jgi:CheY-like chemotaxis protein
MSEDIKSPDGEINIYDAVKRHLPFLRRFARALTGSQQSGDAYTAATLEAIVADRSAFDTSLQPKVALYKSFHAVWSSSGAVGEMPSDQTPAMEAAAQRKMSTLSTDARETFLLGALEGFPIEDVSAITGLSVSEANLLREAALTEIEKQSSARILIIEDEPIIAMDIESIVLELGHTSLGIADTRDTAVQLADDERPDLILSDIQLADGSSGIDAAHDILALFDVPIIFITAFPERLLTGERPEPTFLITKPFKRAAVQAAISQALFFGIPEGAKV